MNKIELKCINETMLPTPATVTPAVLNASNALVMFSTCWILNVALSLNLNVVEFNFWANLQRIEPENENKISCENENKIEKRIKHEMEKIYFQK